MSPLSGVRVLDFTGAEAGLLGKALADLGADVILVPTQVEDRIRTRASLNGQDIHWISRNANKRVASVGESGLAHLAKTADIILNSDGRAQSVGIDLADLSRLKESLITVDVSPYGDRDVSPTSRGSNLSITAAGGYLALCGEPNGPPAETAAPQGYGQAAGQALAATLLALTYRERTSRGVSIDLSSQEAVVNALIHTQQAWFVDRRNEKRGTFRLRGHVISKSIYECRDGYIAWNWYTGVGFGRRTARVVDWMEEEGVAKDLADVDWENTSLNDVTQEMVDSWEERFSEFFASKDKATIAENAVKRGLLLFPVQGLEDILSDPQLASRQAFEKLTVSDGLSFTVPSQYFVSEQIAGRRKQALPKPGAASWIGDSSSCRNGAETIERPLDGLRVLDLSWQMAGPITTKFLGMYGAEVIRVEIRSHPDGSRLVGPWVEKPGIDRSALYANSNLSKRSVSVDLKTAIGHEMALKLASQSDIVIENFRPGVVNRLGLGYEDIRAVNSDVVMLSLSMQGQTGERATQPGLGTHLKALAGIDALTLSGEGTPAGPNYAYIDTIVPWFALTAAMVALRQRMMGRGGSYVDISQYECALHMVAPSLIEHQVREQGGRLEPGACPYGVFETADEDRWCTLAIWNDSEWRRLVEVIDEDWARSDGLASHSGRVEATDEISERLRTWFRRQPISDVVIRLENAGLDAALVAEGEDLHRDKHLENRGHWFTVEHPKLTSVRYDAPSFRASAFEPYLGPPPLLGEHTDWLCRELLGMNDDEVAAAVTDGAIQG